MIGYYLKGTTAKQLLAKLLNSQSHRMVLKETDAKESDRKPLAYIYVEAYDDVNEDRIDPSDWIGCEVVDIVDGVDRYRFCREVSWNSDSGDLN